MDRDLPLNKQQRKEGCIFLTIIGALGIAALILLYLYQAVKN
jgi:hypothetical protein